MKRAWQGAAGSAAGSSAFPSTEDWSSHPYASAYQNLATSIPHNPSPLHNSVQPQVFDPYASGQSDKKQRLGLAGEGSSDGEEGDDGDDDDEDEEGDGEGKDDAGKKKGKDGKVKVKLTRGSK